MIEILGLEKSFRTTHGQVEAIQGIDLSIGEGEFCVLLGPSGCGKTTTLRCIAGLEKPDRGTIRIGNELVSDIEHRVFVQPEMRNIGMVFQSYAVWPHMTVYKNVAFPLVYGRKRLPKNQVAERVMSALRLVKIENLRDRPATDLSGGQQQRVAMARALVTEPQILLMDEPLSNLDARLRQEMRAELKKLTLQIGITCVFVTHDQSEALSLGDVICVMKEGNIVQRGSVEEIYSNPATMFVADFVGDMNSLQGRVRGDRSVETALGTFLCKLPPRVSDAMSVKIAIGPEDIHLLDEGSTGENTFEGFVVNRIFLGTHVQLEIEAGGEKLIVRCSRHMVPEHEKVTLSLPRENLKVFESS